ncbi:MAG TPA: patatin-like phospholipase family protein [Elusimicrobiota bacterium]|nr:patatin-like phospholipase family protein [Elusimicrobiota bacterium]
MNISTEDQLNFLKQIPLFASLGEDELTVLSGALEGRSLPKGSDLFPAGSPTDALYLVWSGRLRFVSVNGGRETVVAFAARGETVGAAAFLTGEPWPVTARADTTSELLVLERKKLDSLLLKIPALAILLTRPLSQHLLKSSRPTSEGPTPSKVMALVSPCPGAEQSAVALNLAVSLAGQTRQRVCLIDLRRVPESPLAAPLELKPVRVGENSLRQEDFQHPEAVGRLFVAHPSGVEFMAMSMSLFDGKFSQTVFPLVSLLRERSPYVLLCLPSDPTPALRAFLQESDEVFLLDKDSPSPDEDALRRDWSAAAGSDKIRRIRLFEKTPVSWGPPTDRLYFCLPWSDSYTKADFLPREAVLSRRLMDRLARKIGGLRIGLAMGSGAAYGYSLIGILKVLEREGIFPDVISGTSMGALLGSFYCLGRSPDEIEGIAGAITKMKLFHMVDPTLPWQGVIIGQGVHRFLKSVLGDVTFDRLLTPLAAVATDIVSGDKVILKEGRVSDAVRASLSLPFFFQPYYLNGRYLVDGGLVDPVPTSVVAAMGADILLSVNLTGKASNKRVPGLRKNSRPFNSPWTAPTLFEILIKTLYTMQFEIAQARAEIAHVVMTPDTSKFTWMQFHRAREISRTGEVCAEEALPRIKACLPCFAGPGAPTDRSDKYID